MFPIQYVLLLLAFLTCQSIDCQKVIKTSGDRDILMKEDGSWEYIDKNQSEPKDSSQILFEENDKTVDPFEVPVEIVRVDSTLIKRKEIVYENLLKAEGLFSEEIEKNKENQKLLTKEKKLAKKGKLQDSTITVEIIEEEIKRYKDQEKDLELRHQITKEYIKELVRTKKELTENDIKSLESRHSALINKKTVQEDQPLFIESIRPDKYTFQTYQTNVLTDPPHKGCNLIYDGRDQETGKIRRDTRPEFLMSYTHEKLESYFRDRDFLTCNAQLSNFGAYYFITLNIDIKSKKATTNYGFIEKSAPIRFLMINGEKIYAKCVKNSHGALEEFTGNTLYSVSYLINEGDLKSLAKQELDTIGLLWTTGFEEYEIYEVDFFQEQVKCLKL